jgi:hypothetical protein
MPDELLSGLRAWRSSGGGILGPTWERRAWWPSETAPAGLIRLSVGVEPAADLIADIDVALNTLEVR